MPQPPILTEDQVRQIVNEQIAASASKNLFDPSKIPVHSHAGPDSLQVDPTDLANSSLYYAVAQTVLSKTQILLLHTTPVTLVPALGVGATNTNINTFIIVEGISAKIYAGATAFAGANNLEFRYTGAAGAKVTADIANTFINTTASTQAYAHVAGITTAFTPVPSSPIVVVIPTANPTLGDGRIVISVKFRVISL